MMVQAVIETDALGKRLDPAVRRLLKHTTSRRTRHRALKPHNPK
jgi:hypothetical protein